MPLTALTAVAARFIRKVYLVTKSKVFSACRIVSRGVDFAISNLSSQAWKTLLLEEHIVVVDSKTPSCLVDSKILAVFGARLRLGAFVLKGM